MDSSLLFHKTPKGEEEMAHRSHGLSPRARSLLIMVNGKVTGEELKKRGDALGGGVDLFQMLAEGGYIEPIAAQGDEIAPAAATPQLNPGHQEAVRFASHFIVESLGPAYDELGGRIESCRDPAQLMHLLEGVREVIDSNAGKKKGEAFWQGVTTRLAVG
jgi:hypothetical protein